MSRRTDSPGFTMIELLVVMAIISLMALIAAPRISAFLGNERQESGLLSAYIGSTSDDAFVHGRTNYLCISLSAPYNETDGLLIRKGFVLNTVAVYNLEEMQLVENSHRILEQRTFSSSFSIIAVYLEGAEAIIKGDVIIPFYPDGSSEGFTIEVLSGDKKRYFKKTKNSRNVLISDEIGLFSMRHEVTRIRAH